MKFSMEIARSWEEEEGEKHELPSWAPESWAKRICKATRPEVTRALAT